MPEKVQERSVAVGEPPWRLPGVFARPRQAEACAALVLLHGSGPNDRDHSVGPHHTFRDLARGLAARGVASLRYDKRTWAYAARMTSPIAPNTTLHDEAVVDALAAHDLLGRMAGIDPARRFLLGYSLGGVAAVRAARAAPSVRGLVLVASSPRPFETCLLDQARYLAALTGPEGAPARGALPRLEQEAKRIKDIIAGAEPQLHEKALGQPIEFWRDLAAHPVVDALANDPRPLLIIHPGRDFQVGAADLASWRSLLESHPAAELRCYEQLNHLLVAGSALPTPADQRIAGALCPAVLDDIAAWIEQFA